MVPVLDGELDGSDEEVDFEKTFHADLITYGYGRCGAPTTVCLVWSESTRPWKLRSASNSLSSPTRTFRLEGPSLLAAGLWNST